MANTAAAKKALRVSVRKAAINTRVTKEYKSEVKSIKKLIETGDVKKANALLPKVQSKLDAAVKKGVLHPNTGSRYKSRVAQALKKASKK